jgi:hypothetical protein
VYNFSSVTEGLFALSFGLTQMMGESLYERRFFQWHYDNVIATNAIQKPDEGFWHVFSQPLQNLHVAYAIDEYCAHPGWQVEWGCKHLAVKRDLAHGQTIPMLRYWNGDISGAKHYAEDVLGRKSKLSAIYQR